MLRVTFALLTVGITLFAFIDCLRCSDAEVRGWPRNVWCLVTLVPLIGGIAWLAYGGRGESLNKPVSRPSAPDDDPDFLRSLDRRLNSQLDDHPGPDVPETPAGDTPKTPDPGPEESTGEEKRDSDPPDPSAR